MLPIISSPPLLPNIRPLGAGSMVVRKGFSIKQAISYSLFLDFFHYLLIYFPIPSFISSHFPFLYAFPSLLNLFFVYLFIHSYLLLSFFFIVTFLFLSSIPSAFYLFFARMFLFFCLPFYLLSQLINIKMYLRRIFFTLNWLRVPSSGGICL